LYELRPVPLSSKRTDDRLGFLGVLAVAALAIVVVKPWGGQTAPAAAVDEPVPGLTLPPSLPSSPILPVTGVPDVGYGSRLYDATIFGTHEPAPAWSIWPAGYLVTFGFVDQVPDLSAPLQPTTAPSAVGGGGPDLPAGFEVPDGKHLLLVGINMPIGYSVGAAGLVGLDGNGGVRRLDLARLRSPWPGHFAVFGRLTAPDPGLLSTWLPGRYRLDLEFLPGRVTRSIGIVIAGRSSEPAASPPAPAPSGAPAP
jgi:hypothetical protein